MRGFTVVMAEWEGGAAERFSTFSAAWHAAELHFVSFAFAVSTPSLFSARLDELCQACDDERQHRWCNSLLTLCHGWALGQRAWLLEWLRRPGCSSLVPLLKAPRQLYIALLPVSYPRTSR